VHQSETVENLSDIPISVVLLVDAGSVWLEVQCLMCQAQRAKPSRDGLTGSSVYVRMCFFFLLFGQAYLHCLQQLEEKVLTSWNPDLYILLVSLTISFGRHWFLIVSFKKKMQLLPELLVLVFHTVTVFNHTRPVFHHEQH